MVTFAAIESPSQLSTQPSSPPASLSFRTLKKETIYTLLQKRLDRWIFWFWLILKNVLMIDRRGIYAYSVKNPIQYFIMYLFSSFQRGMQN